MPTTVVKGAASRVSRSTNVSGTSGDQGVVSTTQVLNLLIDTTPVQYAARSLVMLENGDQVAAAGRLRNGVLYAGAFRNVTTGVVYRTPPWQVGVTFAGAGLCAAFGLLFLGFGGLGILPLGGGAWLFWTAKNAAAAAKAI
jgi:hypothetical protein